MRQNPKFNILIDFGFLCLYYDFIMKNILILNIFLREKERGIAAGIDYSCCLCLLGKNQIEEMDHKQGGLMEFFQKIKEVIGHTPTLTKITNNVILFGNEKFNFLVMCCGR